MTHYSLLRSVLRALCQLRVEMFENEPPLLQPKLVGHYGALF